MATWERPISEKQELAIRSSADLIFLTGPGGTGKTRIACQLITSLIYFTPKVRISYFINNWGEYTNQGGILPEMENVFVLDTHDRKRLNSIGSLTRTPNNMALEFNNGSVITFNAIEDINRAQLTDKSKTFQFDIAIFEEAQRMSWDYINILWTRVRNTDPTIPCKIYIIQNPERECAVRKMCGVENEQAGWIDENGDVIPQNNCSIRYMFQNEGRLHETYWGQTAEECYKKCSHHIKNKIGDIKDVDYRNFIFKVQFISFTKEDNKKIFEHGKYLARLAQSSIGASMGDGNWNFSKNDVSENADNITLPISALSKCFTTSPNRNGFITMSADLAGVGEDNSIIIGMDGWHVFDIWVEGKTVGNQRSNFIERFADKYKIRMNQKNSIIDCVRFDDVLEYFSRKNGMLDGNGMPSRKKAPFKTFIAAEPPYKNNNYSNIKSQCANLMLKMLNAQVITFEPELESRLYYNQRGSMRGIGKKNITVKDEIMLESMAIKFTHKNGKVSLISKKEQKDVIKRRSTDILDCLIMRIALNVEDAYRALNNVKKEANKENVVVEAFKHSFELREYGRNPQNRVQFGNQSDFFRKLSNF